LNSIKYHIVSTIGQKCKRCYSCIRECPAAAIRVMDGQAVVLSDRCISCGHCVKVCSQNAKEIYSEVDKVLHELLPTGNTVAIIAPSFAASFPKQL
jgi:two-component system NtrC family sensor kinase